ncbi:mitochondrial carrier homolog 1-like [Daktulosphaira vitifoliae]|uniref:mitochondrial carrier homolog 1-like n=1 Tax=Daktulosphaira vitifoliae TaxID=58002 RepID=UPI0021AA3746|nr:mitochondrial carrier homolog 1-like [Daktulosphaira vitifoliae]
MTNPRIEDFRDQNVESPWNGLTFKIIGKTAIHPVEYAKFLIQIGHEPIRPVLYKPIIGEPRLVLPNVFSYSKYIYQIDGFKGMYSGLAPKLVGVFVEHCTTWFITNYVKLEKKQILDTEESESDAWKKWALNTSKELLSTIASNILSYPFRLISLRIMAQFVGFEKNYTGVLGSTIVIIRQEGISGLYSGFWPHLIFVSSHVAIVSLIKHVCSRYLFDPSPIALTMTDLAASHIATTITYPLNVVSACMTINDCGLVAGMPPDMPVFGNWLECMKYLSKLDQLHRGSSMFQRNVIYAKPNISKMN